MLVTTILSSCDRRANESDGQEINNQVYITDEGDSVETGFWQFESGPNGISSHGNFEDGFRQGSWTYKITSDSATIMWAVFNEDSIRLNLPGNIVMTTQELPVVFLVTIGTNKHCYYTLLKYDLRQITYSAYDYIFQYIQSLEDGTTERLIRREVKKFTFKTIEVFWVTVDLEGDHKYKSLSYIFVINGILYDLTYRNETDKVGDIELEIFKEILYSFQTPNFDPFNFNVKHYTKEENVDIRTPIQN